MTVIPLTEGNVIYEINIMLVFCYVFNIALLIYCDTVTLSTLKATRMYYSI